MIMTCSHMGREVTGIRVQKKVNDAVVASNGVCHDKVNVAPKVGEESFEEKEYEVKECTEEKPVVEQYHGEQATLIDKSKNFAVSHEGASEIENEKPAIQRSSDLKKTSSPASKSPAVRNVRTSNTLSQPLALAPEKQSTCTLTAGTETAASANVNSPNATKNLQVVNLLSY